MGMFDKTPTLTETFGVDSEFILWSGEFLGRSKHAEYGENDAAEVKASPAGTPQGDAKDYRVFGVLADQIRRQSEGDLPAVVKITKDGRANVFTFVSKEVYGEAMPA